MTTIRSNQGSAPREAIAFSRKPYVSARAVGSFLPTLTAKAFQKYGFSTVSLITDWPAIVGKDLASHTVPERLKWRRATGQAEHDDTESAGDRPGATLVLRVDSARALNVQYQARQIIERINGYFGYAAIAELRLVQAPADVPPVRRNRLPAQPATVEVAGIADADLRGALARLGGEIRAIR